VKILEDPRDLDRLKAGLLGRWEMEVSGTMPDGRAVSGTGLATAVEISLGKGIHTETKMTIEGEPYEEHDLWGYDRRRQRLRVFTVTSDGTIHAHLGRWKDERTLEVRWKGKRDGRDVAEDVTMTWESPDTIRIQSGEVHEGIMGPSFTFTLTRQK
jgi:hypothetical protein